MSFGDLQLSVGKVVLKHFAAAATTPLSHTSSGCNPFCLCVCNGSGTPGYLFLWLHCFTQEQLRILHVSFRFSHAKRRFTKPIFLLNSEAFSLEKAGEFRLNPCSRTSSQTCPILQCDGWSTPEWRERESTRATQEGCSCLFAYAVGSFLLTVEVFYLQLTISAFLLTIGAFFAYKFSFSACNWSFFAYNRKVRLIRAFRDCKQRSLTVSKKALTVSKNCSPPSLEGLTNGSDQGALGISYSQGGSGPKHPLWTVISFIYCHCGRNYYIMNSKPILYPKIGYTTGQSIWNNYVM